MMSTDGFKALTRETLQNPRSAARRIMALNLSRDVLWSALVLGGAIYSLIFSMSLLTADTSVLPPLFRNPLMFFMLFTGIQILTVHVFYWTGRALGGRGDLGEMLALLVWLLILQAIAQVITMVLILFAPVIGQIFSTLVGFIGLWLTVNFVAEALRFPSLLYALGVMVLAAVGLVFGLAIFAGLIGIAALGVPANV